MFAAFSTALSDRGLSVMKMFEDLLMSDNDFRVSGHPVVQSLLTVLKTRFIFVPSLMARISKGGTKKRVSSSFVFGSKSLILLSLSGLFEI